MNEALNMLGFSFFTKIFKNLNSLKFEKNKYLFILNIKYHQHIMISQIFDIITNTFLYLRYGKKQYTNEKNVKWLIESFNTTTYDMTEIRTKSDKLENTSGYYDVISYMAGNCYVNSKLSNNKPLNTNDQKILNGINYLVSQVEPLSYAVRLFHGFELLTKYNEKLWRVGSNFQILGFVSKTPSFNVAHKFAHAYNPYVPRFLVVSYPIGSQHVNIDMRNKSDEEYEYLTRSGETFVIEDIVTVIVLPKRFVFYFVRPE